MAIYILIFIISFYLGFLCAYYAAKNDIKNVKNLEELKIMYYVKEEK